MITVGFAKKKGVVFVEGDVIGYPVVNIGDLSFDVNYSSVADNWPVTSFTDRKHTGNEMPCSGGLPVVVTLRGELRNKGLADEYVWDSDSYCPILSWKPDLEALEKLANEKEDKPMAEKQYTYELVTDLSTNEIAKAMIDGEVFYSDDGTLTYQWKNNGYHNGAVQLSGLNSLDFYRRKEIETITRTITYPKPVSEPLNYKEEYWLLNANRVSRDMWEDSWIDTDRMKQNRIHLTKENAQAHWDAIFGNK